jgi:GR25 family glycosyltransferase involved in LPS biosynthesis
MADGRLLVIVIRTPNSDRYRPIESILKNDKRFELEYIEASMTPTYHDVKSRNIAYSTEIFEYFHGRKLTPPEIGCADSHNRARNLIQYSSNGGVILEDDARVIDVDLLYNVSFLFLNSNQGFKSILSLTPFNRLIKNQNKKIKIIRVLGTTDLAVAYALTPSAAKSLIKVNQPIASVADWPKSTCKFHITNVQSITHGDSNTKSTIIVDEKDFRNDYAFKLKLNQFFLLTMHKRPPNLKLQEYLNVVFMKRIFWYFEKVRLLVIGFRPKK